MDWFKKNKMAVNLDKFQGTVLDKWKSDHTERITVDNQQLAYN